MKTPNGCVQGGLHFGCFVSVSPERGPIIFDTWGVHIYHDSNGSSRTHEAVLHPNNFADRQNAGHRENLHAVCTCSKSHWNGNPPKTIISDQNSLALRARHTPALGGRHFLLQLLETLLHGAWGMEG